MEFTICYYMKLALAAQQNKLTTKLNNKGQEKKKNNIILINQFLMFQKHQ